MLCTDPVVVNGWGAEQYEQPMSDVLMRVTVDSYSDGYCQTFMNQTVPDNLLCIGTEERGIGSCIGDAGAPVTAITRGGVQYLAGILSHFGCTEPLCKIK
jgi:hypothetical protein